MVELIIINADDVMRSQGHKTMARWMIGLLQERPAGERILSLCREMLLAPPGQEAPGAAALARVAEGRWIVRCLFCPSAQFAHPEERRMWCIECQHLAVGGKWVRVEWPAARAAIEAALVVRPAPQNRWWNPGDTVAELLALNEAHGIRPAPEVHA